MQRYSISFAFACALAAPIALAANPADPQAMVPSHQYESAFAGYESPAETSLKDWRDANAEVMGGGHAGHGGGQMHDMHDSPNQGENNELDEHRH